jgi:hypothetical protein
VATYDSFLSIVTILPACRHTYTTTVRYSFGCLF